MLADRISARVARAEPRYSADTWFNQFLLPSLNQFTYGGNSYGYGLNSSYNTLAVTEVSNTLPSYMNAVRNCPPAFAAEMVRALVLSQARFIFRNPPSSRTPRRQFGTQALAPLEKPWPNATTGELLARMEWHAGLAGNAYVTNRTPGRLRVLRPDWVAILYGSQQEPELAAQALDGELIGYAYCPGGLANYGMGVAPAGGGKMYTLLPDEVAHWSPLPDPLAAGIGMSWLTPAIREIQGDIVAAQHKVQFFANAATPNLVIKGIPAMTETQFNDLVNMMEAQHAGAANAYKTLYLTAGADATVVGANMQQIDFKATVGSGETRIAALSRVPAPVLGISEGLAGSSLNAGNYGQSRRNFADTWIYPMLQDLCSALSALVRVPSDAELWFDTVDMPLLREDARDAADIAEVQARTVTLLVREGFTAETAVAATIGQNMSLLKHSGLTSVQLQPPMPDQQPPGKGEPPAGGTRSADEEPDEVTRALIEALAEFDDDIRSRFNPADHPRNPKGAPGGGRFRSVVDRIVDAIQKHLDTGEGDPFEGFDREQLRKAAKARGHTLPRGITERELKDLLLSDVGKGGKEKPTPKAPAPRKMSGSKSSARALTGEDALNAAPYNLSVANGNAVLPDRSVEQAISRYGNHGFRQINSHLRGETGFTGPLAGEYEKQANEWVAQIDRAMAASHLKDDIVVHRGVTSIQDTIGHSGEGDLTGLTFGDAAYGSTTADRAIAEHYAGEAIMRIAVPKGTPAITLSGSNRESEILLDRGLEFRVTRDGGVVDGVRQLDVEVVPAHKPKPPAESVADLPRMAKPPTLRTAAKGTNPNFGTTTTGPVYRDAAMADLNWTPDMGPPPSGAYEENCTNCVQAFEMRMRGYDVEAAPLDVLDRYGYAAGRTYAQVDAQLAVAWRLPNGKPHGRSFHGQKWLSFDEADAVVRGWPDGARGYMTVGKHVFNVVNVGGQVRYVDAQVDANAGRDMTKVYKKKYKASGMWSTIEEAKVIRLDDLEPAEGILKAVTSR